MIDVTVSQYQNRKIETFSIETQVQKSINFTPIIFIYGRFKKDS